MMMSVIISSPEELDAAIDEHSKIGYRLAAVSNAGLSKEPGKRRVTFLHESCFTKEPSAGSEAEFGDGL